MSENLENTNVETATNEASKEVVNTQATVTDPAILKAMEKAQAKINKKAEKDAKKAMSEAEVSKLLDSIQSEDMKVIAKLLVDIKHENEKQAQYVKRHSICSMCSAILCFILVCIVFIWGVKFAPTIEQIANDAQVLIADTNALINDTTAAVANANNILIEANDILAQTDVIIENLDAITTDLANVKIEDMMKNVNDLVVSTEENMTSAVSKIEDIDIDSLNQAIKDLQAVVEPLSRLFKK